MVGNYRTYPEGNSIDMAGDVVGMLKFWAGVQALSSRVSQRLFSLKWGAHMFIGAHV